MIVTLTVNPSLDRTVELPGTLVRGAVQRAAAISEDPGGKGVNVCRALTASVRWSRHPNGPGASVRRRGFPGAAVGTA